MPDSKAGFSLDGGAAADMVLISATDVSASFSRGAPGSVGVNGTGVNSAAINSTGPLANVSGNVT